MINGQLKVIKNVHNYGDIEMTQGRSLLRIIVCDDDPADQKLIRTYFRQVQSPEIALMEASNEDELNAILDKGKVDLILLDVHMPGKADFTCLSQVIQRDIAPVVVMSGLGSEEVAVKALHIGAVSYLPKSRLSLDGLKEMTEEALQRWDGIQRSKANQEELEKLANFDSLTGLYNRRVILRELGYYIRFAHRYKDELSLIMLDIDDFKKVNDEYGHLAGDSVLEKMAALMKAGIRDTDEAGRYGGEEFLVILPRTNVNSALDVAERIRRNIEAANMIDDSGDVFHITVSLGLSLYQDGDDERSLISRADQALYAAKSNGKNRIETIY